MNEAPILLIAFNRPEITLKVFEAIRESKPKKFYVSVDAPRNENFNDIEKCARVKDILKLVDWDCELNTLFQTTNQGCSLGPRKAFEWFFENEEMGIILEDDCLPSKSFFTFCSELLFKYRNDKRIISISGCNLNYNGAENNSVIFSRIMNMWGWGTWRRVANKIDYNLVDWKNSKNKMWKATRLLQQHFLDTDINWFKYWRSRFNQTIEQETITWWDWQWIYYQLVNKMYSVVPTKNLVVNLGFNEQATHTFDKNNPAASLKSEEVLFPLKVPKKIFPDYQYEEYNIKWVLCYHKRLPWHFYIRNYIKYYFSKFYK